MHKEAASIIVVASQTGRVLVMRRSSKSSFFPDAFVFPGGRVDPADKLLPGSYLKHTAVRELFEETGLLLCSPKTTISRNLRHSHRIRVLEKASEFSSLCKELGVGIDTESLLPWARWATPKAEPRRQFDTYFYLTQVPSEDSSVSTDPFGEASQVAWIHPKDLLASNRRGEIQLAPPTVYLLQELVTGVPKGARDMRCVHPQISVVSGSVSILLPGDESFDGVDKDSLCPRDLNESLAARFQGVHRLVKVSLDKTKFYWEIRKGVNKL